MLPGPPTRADAGTPPVTRPRSLDFGAGLSDCDWVGGRAGPHPLAGTGAVMVSSEDGAPAGSAEPERPAGRAGGSARGRVFLGLVSAVALLMLGTSVGMLINAPSEQRADPEPSAVDIGFAQDMTSHDQQSVRLAALGAERARDPAVHRVARDVETKQRDQVGRMQGWLSLWGEPAESPAPPLAWMTDGAAPDQRAGAQALAGPAEMPGMASDADLARLHSLRGPRFDAEFLRLLLRHLQGSSTIAQYAAEHGSQSAVQQLGSTVVDQQDGQMQQVRHMLAVRRVPPLPSR